jgi:2-dehydro-3-deoxy-D-arabinonate dehydratase
MKLYLTNSGCVVEKDLNFYSISDSWDQLAVREDLETYLNSAAHRAPKLPGNSLALRAPIGTQEVWAAGVTYLRSRAARMEESKSAGGGDFYDRVYNAARPELFFKANPSSVVGHQAKVAIRKDATWSVPEPELTLMVTPGGKIVGYTVGNDMSSRDIEGENPLYLPQAKVYHRSCALGPGVLISSSPLPSSNKIQVEILRSGQMTFSDSTTLASMKRSPAELVEYLYRENVFPNGCFLMTGTGIVPPDAFTLNNGDEIRITIDGIGTLTNTVG